MSPIQRLRPAGLVVSPAFSHVAVVPPGATTPQLASDEPAVVTGARVAALGVPGALVGISAVAALLEKARGQKKGAGG